MDHANAPLLTAEYFKNGRAGKGTERAGVGDGVARRFMQTPFRTRIHATHSLEELDHAVAGLPLRAPDVVVLDGGDGTLNVVFTRILRAYAAYPHLKLPMFLYIPTGTMRLVGSSLGLNAFDPLVLADKVFAMLVNGGRRPFGDSDMLRVGDRDIDVPVVRSHIMRINQEYGFIYGAGIPVNFLNEYYKGETLGPFGAGRVLFETMTDELKSALFMEDSQRLLTKPVRGTIWQRESGSGSLINRSEHTAVMASTVEEVGFGFKGMPLARSKPGRFMVRSTGLSFFELAAMAPALVLGNFLPGVTDGVVDHMSIEWLEPTATTVDGEMRAPHDSDVISCGPELRFLRP